MEKQIIETISTWDGKEKIASHSVGSSVHVEVAIGDDVDAPSTEQLFIMSISAGFMERFLSLARHEKIEISVLTCNAIATYDLPCSTATIKQIILTPSIIVTKTYFIRDTLIMIEKAHRSCALFSTVNIEIILAPSVKTSEQNDIKIS